MGETGHWNGEDVIDIILKQPGTARFIARHLYNFFVADEPQVPAWKDTAPRDVEAIQTLEKAIIDNDYEMRPVYRTLFNSEFFKEARFQKVKSPAEVVIGTVRLTGDHQGEIKRGMFEIMQECTYMGQDLMNPPSVEGWHTGREWIDSGTLVERINFVADQIAQRAPGVQLIIDRLSDGTASLSSEEFVDGCLDLIGPVEVKDDTRRSLIEYTTANGELKRDSEEARASSADRVVEMLQLISATAEYQYA